MVSYTYVCVIIQKIVVMNGKKLLKLILGAASLSSITIQKFNTYVYCMYIQRVCNFKIGHGHYDLPC